MKLTNNLDVSWDNAFKPTPRNVELFLKGNRRILAVIGSASFLAGYEWVLFILTILQSVLEEISIFIAEATKGTVTEVTTKVTVPEGLQKEVKITTETTQIDSKDKKDSETE